MSGSVTVATPPTTAEVAIQVVAYIAGQSGVVTDANIGSQVRTLAEGMGQVAELEGVSAYALALQAMLYGCFAAFGIFPLPATQAQGILTFSTGSTNPPPATQNVVIQAGTIAATTQGIQYVTTENVTLLQGQTACAVSAQAVVPGAAGNTGIGTVISIVSGVPYPLYVNNGSQFVDGTDAETLNGTLARFTAEVQSIGLASPVAIANAAIGVQAPNSTETVKYATCYEPFTQQPIGQQTAGWVVYIDNGAGTASTDLINAVMTKFNGSFAAGLSGFRDAGVPWSVVAVNPINFSVVVTGALSDPTQDVTLEAACDAAVQAYANGSNGTTGLAFNQSPQQPQITAVVGDVLYDAATSFLVTMYNASNVAVTTIPITGPGQRAILTSVTTTLD